MCVVQSYIWHNAFLLHNMYYICDRLYGKPNHTGIFGGRGAWIAHGSHMPGFPKLWSHNIMVTRLHGPILLSKVVTCFILPIVIFIIDSKKRPHHLCLIVYYIPEILNWNFNHMVTANLTDHFIPHCPVPFKRYLRVRRLGTTNC